jgi:hypothetical protein
VAAVIEAREALAARDFTVHRHEHHYLVPTAAPAVHEVRTPDGFAVISAADADVDRLRELDDALRQDVPGAPGAVELIRPAVVDGPPNGGAR